RRVGVVETQVAAAAELLGDAEVQADRLGVADVQVTVGFGREAGADRIVLAAGQVVADDLPDEVMPDEVVLDGVVPEGVVRGRFVVGVVRGHWRQPLGETASLAELSGCIPPPPRAGNGSPAPAGGCCCRRASASRWTGPCAGPAGRCPPAPGSTPCPGCRRQIGRA